MDSEPLSKPIDSENSQITENLRENVPTVNFIEDNEKNESPADKAVVEIVEAKDEKDSENPETASETQTTSTIVAKTENDDENLEIQTTTRTILSNKTTEDGESVETNTKETVVDTETSKESKEEVVQEKTPVESTETEIPDSESESEESEEEEEDVKNEQEKELKKNEKDDEKEKNKVEEVKKMDEGREKEGELVVKEAEKLKVENVEAIETKLEGPGIQKENDVALEKKASNVNLDINNQIENIISDIDISIRAQEKITQLKEQELQLIHKQKELANQIQKQQLLAQKLLAENQRKEQELKEQEFLNRNQYREEYLAKATQQDLYEPKETSNVSRTVDLRKIFTPATDAVEILPKNRKLYASSAFYSPNLHPTVEDQVELARRISHSLSDISNQTSKGQSMYVNRKKRSVKWVHEGCGQGEIDEIESQALCKENEEESLPKELTKLEKLPLKLIMNPHGQMRDYNSLKESINIKTGLLSPENCAELITALQLQKGRGAELFAKRRRKADNWVVDETNAGTHSPSGLSDYQPYKAKPASSPNLLPAYSDAGKHRVQLNIHQENLIEKYAKPGIQVVKSPWEAALQTGSASSAFVNDNKYGSQTPIIETASPLNLERDVGDYPKSRSFQSDTTYGIAPVSNTANQDIYKNDHFINPQRELAYKPNVAQGWGGRNVELPREYYLQDIYAYESHSNDDNVYGLYSNANTNISKAGSTDNVKTAKIDDEMQQRLQKLEEFQEIFLKQQRLALADLAGLVMRPPSAEVEYINKDVDTISSLPSKIIDEESLEDNASVNVRSLISSFEQQSLRDYGEYQKNRCKRYPTSAKTTEKYCFSSEESNMKITTDQLGLYIPKEISLASYAPPPAVGGVSQSSLASYPQALGVSGLNQSYYSPRQQSPRGEFDREGQPTQTGGGFPVYSVSPGPYNAEPPKQQFNDPASYQKIPPSRSQGGPHVNFNPSPLSFEKLSKFQEPNQQNTKRYNNVNKPTTGFGGVIRNSVTVPFPAGNENNSTFYRSLPHEFVGNHQFNSQLMASQTQSFNNCARGWKSTPNSQQIPYYTKGVLSPSVASNSLPYTDF